MSKRLFIDYSKCIGCETCEMVCKFNHGQPRIHMTRSKAGVMMPLYCQHCDNPQCQRVCTKGAITRDLDGALCLDRSACADCEHKECLQFCPFGSIFCTGDLELPVVKCDMCAERREQGLGPACVEMCPCQAILYVDRDAVPSLQTPEAAEAFKRVMQHVKPPKDLPNLRSDADDKKKK